MLNRNPDAFFITFEGPECAGKTTQIRLLEEHFNAAGRRHISTREPGGTVVGEELRRIVKHHVGESAVVDEAELLLFAASRAQHVRKVILPALDQGLAVICDRFTDSTLAYQGYARGLDLGFIRSLNDFAACGCVPDLTVVLDLTPEQSLERGSRRQETLFVEDRIESEKIDFHRRVREGFLRIAREEPERVKVLCAARPVEAIHSDILELLKHASE